MSNEEAKKAGRLRLGVIGLGVGASSVLSRIARSPFSELAAGADINPRVIERFKKAYPDARACNSAEDLCRSKEVDAVWISSPTYLHADHAILAAKHGKHIIISKPFAATFDEAARMVEVCEKAGVKLLAGHSLGFSPAIRQMARLAQADQAMGRVHAIQMMAFTDWLLLPRAPDEVDALKGGGLLNRQSPHQIDAARLLGGGLVESVSAYTGQWMKERPSAGFFSAFLRFKTDAVATISHNGYGYFVSSEIPGWGKDAGITGLTLEERNRARASLRDGSVDEARLKDEQRLGGTSPLFNLDSGRKAWLPLHLGLTLVTCERGDMRHSPFGLYLYSDEGRQDIQLDDDDSWFGATEIEELYRAVREGEPLYRDGLWGLATIEVTAAIEESQRTRREVRLNHQTPVRAGALAPDATNVMSTVK